MPHLQPSSELFRGAGRELLSNIKNGRPPLWETAGSDCRKTLEELERAKALSNFNRAQRHVRWAREDFCGGKSHFPEQKSFPCSFCARKSERFQQKLVGVAVAGELAPPSTSLSKSFLTSWAGRLFWRRPAFCCARGITRAWRCSFCRRWNCPDPAVRPGGTGRTFPPPGGTGRRTARPPPG